MSRALTTKYGKLVRILTAHVQVCHPFRNTDLDDRKIEMYRFAGIWDTGANGSVITKRVVETLKLKPISFVDVYHAGGKSMVNVYLINLALENDLMLMDVKVTEADLMDDHTPEHERFDVLIGMDVIGAGDFAITNYRRKTTLTFRVPSRKELDFTKKK